MKELRHCWKKACMVIALGLTGVMHNIHALSIFFASSYPLEDCIVHRNGSSLCCSDAGNRE